jgi:hypothetical protein
MKNLNKFRSIYIAKRSQRNISMDALDAGAAPIHGEVSLSPAKQIEAAEKKAGVAPSGYAGIDADAEQIVQPRGNGGCDEQQLRQLYELAKAMVALYEKLDEGKAAK